MRSFTNTERKEIVSYFNQEKALVGAFLVIVKSSQTLIWNFSA